MSTPTADPALRMRRANRLAGALVLLALALLVGAALQAGVLRAWLNPPLTLRILLPENGVAGLAVGAEVQVLGITAGRVNRIVIAPDRPLSAEAQIDRGASGFIRRDSRITIRRQFGVAGAAFLDVTRGTGPALDWDFAVIQAEIDRSAGDNLGTLIEELRGKINPLIDDLGRTANNVAQITQGLAAPEGPLQSTLSAFASTAQRIERGEGNVGRLLSDESIIGEVETILAQARAITADLARTTAALSDNNTGLPGVTRRAGEAAGNIATATRQAPNTARDVRVATGALPGLLIQVQQATLELERLLVALRSNPLVGGGRGSNDPPDRLPASEVRP